MALGHLESVPAGGGDDGSTGAPDALRAVFSPDPGPGDTGSQPRPDRAAAENSDPLEFGRKEIAELRGQGELCPWAQVLISAAFGTQEIKAAELERAYVETLLWRHSRARVLRILGWNSSTLYRKVEDWDKAPESVSKRRTWNPRRNR